MTIKELEDRLGISRANIRYYEKEGLFTTERQANGYREYTEENVCTLKKIILFRKMGISIENIHLLIDGSMTIDEVLSETLEILQDQQKQLEGAIAICEEMERQKPNINELDVSYYENLVIEQEKLGLKFMDFYRDYLKYEKNVLVERYVGEQATDDDSVTFIHVIKKIILNASVCGLVWMVLGRVEGKNVLHLGIKGFVFVLGLIGINAVLRIPYYIYMRMMAGRKIKYPNLTEIYLGILTIMFAILLGNWIF